MIDKSQFDPNVYLNATLTEPTERRNPLPPGDYTAQIGKPATRLWSSRADPSKSGVAVDVPLFVEVPFDIQEELKLNSSILTINDSVMLDLTEGGHIDNTPGRNRKMRAYREAVDLNKAGDAFSWSSLEGKLVRVKISNEIAVIQGVESVVERVSAVSKM